MEHYQSTYTDSNGNTINGATVTVYTATGAVATIYDHLGSPQANPFLTGLNRSEGEIEFAAADGRYDIKIENGVETDWIYAQALLDSGDGFTATGTLQSGYVVATKTEAEALTPEDGRKIFITSADGGEFTMKTGASVGTYNDNAGAFCGTQFTAGDGSSGFLRDFGGLINVKWFGAVGDESADDTTPIQNAIDYIADALLAGAWSTAGGGSVYVPAGAYSITRLIRRSGVSIIGDGSRSTFFVARTLTSAVPYGMLEIEPGPVVASHIKGFTLLGSSSITTTTVVNTSQWAIYSHAQWDAGYVQGGLWFSTAEDIEARFFNYGMWSRAGYTSAHSLRPNQFLDFLNCRFFVASGGEAVRFTGQHGQIHVRNGDYSGFSGTTATRCVTVDWDPDPSTTADDSSGHGESTSDTSGVGNAVRAGENIVFSDGASVQRSDLGVYVRNAHSVIFSGCWLESLGKGFQIESNGAVKVRECHLGNVGNGSYLSTPSPGNGWLVSLGTNGSIDFDSSNDIAGTTDSFCISTQNLTTTARATIQEVNKSTVGLTGITTPITTAVSAAGALDVKGHDLVLVSPYASDKSVTLDDIDSYFGPGAVITLYAYTEAITLSSAGNIRLPSALSVLTIGNRTHVTLQRVWAYATYEWHVISYTDEYANALPSSGEYYTAGTRIWDPSPAAGGSPGWICTTTGLAGSTAVFKAMANLAA